MGSTPITRSMRIDLNATYEKSLVLQGFSFFVTNEPVKYFKIGDARFDVE